MFFKIIARAQNVVSDWAGGTTSQVAIFPEEARYQERDFMWRISSAMVNLEQSDFTVLPSYDRTLVVLEGAVRLDVDGKLHCLQAFEALTFDGGAHTKSYGKIRDFNLMYRKGTAGSVEVLTLTIGKKSVALCKPRREQSHIFFCCDSCKMSINNTLIALEKYDALLIQLGANEKLEVLAAGIGRLIHASIE